MLSPECFSFCALQAEQVVAIETVLPEIGLFDFLNGQLQHQHIGPHEEVEEQCVRWSGLQMQHHDGVVDVPV